MMAWMCRIVVRGRVAENLEGIALWGRKTLHCLDSPGSLRTGIHDSASGSAPAFGLVVWTRVGGAVGGV